MPGSAQTSSFDGDIRPNGRRAIVFGADGQDGTHLCRLLKTEGTEVLGVGRLRLNLDRDDSPPIAVSDPSAVNLLVSRFRPDEVYYLAAHHHSTQQDVEELSELFDKSFEIHCAGYRNVLEAVVSSRLQTRVFYAASALVFGYPEHSPQSEKTPMAPVCAYGVTKAAGVGIGRVYRAEHGVFSCAGILFNHESPLRRPEFVTRKLASAAADIARGRRSAVQVGSLAAEVDWGAAEDYVRAMVQMLRLDTPEDYVVATGKLHTVRDFAERAFAAAGLDYRCHVSEAPNLVRRRVRKVPLCGDSARLRAATGWQPEISFDELVGRMVAVEFERG